MKKLGSKAATRPKKPKQDQLPIAGPGVAPVRIKELDDAAEEYVRVRDRRMDLLKKEIDLKGDLLELVHKHEDKIGRDGDGVLRYKVEDEDLIVESAHGEETIKVKRASSNGAEE